MRIVSTIAVLAFVFAAGTFSQSSQPFDAVVAGGRIVDGTGNHWYVADVGIRGGVITQIGNLSGSPRRRTISANGKVVAPGFIDMLVGSSIPLLLDPRAADSKLLQGITTIHVGEGDSMAPQNEETLKDFPASDHLPIWRSFAEYSELLEKKGIAINVVHNVGASQVRRVVMGEANNQPSAEQLGHMKVLVDEAMGHGATGLSSALIYPPGAFASTSELVELAKITASRHGVYFTHIRNEGRDLLASVEEAIQIGREAGIPVHIYHLKAAGQENWKLFETALKLIENARESGIDVTADIYPYLRNGIPLTSFLPPKYFEEGSEKILDHLTDIPTKEKIRQELRTTSDWENWYLHAGSDWNNVLIAEVPAELDRAYEGKSVTQVSRLRTEDPWETFFFLLRIGRGEINVDPLTMDERQKHAALEKDFICIASDSAPTNLKNATTAHPRTFGTFPRILAKYVREDRVLSLEAAVRAMSSLPADVLRLTDRGRIALGMSADLVIFDPARIQDMSTFEQPLAYPKGVNYVLVNGGIAVDAGRITALKYGRVLQHKP